MASTGKVMHVARHLLGISSRFPNVRGVTRHASNVVSYTESENVEYPPVRPRYPPGTWDKHLIKKGSQACWDEYEKGQELLRIPSMKARLENMSGRENKFQYLVHPFDMMPGNGEYKQYISKTHIERNCLPGAMTNIDCDDKFTLLKKALTDAIAQEHEFHYIHRIENGRWGKRYHPIERTSLMLQNIVNEIIAMCSDDNSWLVEAQVDRDVRIETFWSRSGFDDEDIKSVGKVGGGKYRLQYRGGAKCQIRTDLPLPEFIPFGDELCSAGSYPKISYGPSILSQKHEKERCRTVSGHWIGDPCEFNHLSVHQVPSNIADIRASCGDEVAAEELETYGMISAFASCLSQAYNQGFTSHHEITYPFTTQSMVVDETGKTAQFFGYQLNTIQLDKDDEANPKQNICWASKPLTLFDTVERGEVNGFNEDAFKQLVRMFLVKPGERGVDLRPYLPEDPAPGEDARYINHLGEEPIERPPIGRYQYPKNAVYF